MDVLSDATCATEEDNSNNYEIASNGKLTKECETAHNMRGSITVDRVTSSSDGSVDLGGPNNLIQILPNSAECRRTQSMVSSKGRRRRTSFSNLQLNELEREFQAKKYLSLTERSQIAHHLSLSEVS